MENRCLGAHPGSLNKNLVARTRNLGAPGYRAPVRQQPCAVYNISRLVSFLLRVTEVFCMEYTTHKMLACFKVFCSVNHSQLEGNEVFDRKVDRLKRCVNPWFMFSWNFRIQKIIHKNTILLRKMYHKRTTLKMVTPLICIRLNILTSEGHK